jgi:hypothetical protein
MKKVLRVVTFFTVAIGPSDVITQLLAIAPQPTTVEASESAAVQPEGSRFAPNSAEDDVVQGRITIFNDTQRALDRASDRKLRFCRGC